MVSKVSQWVRCSVKCWEGPERFRNLDFLKYHSWPKIIRKKRKNTKKMHSVSYCLSFEYVDNLTETSHHTLFKTWKWIVFLMILHSSVVIVRVPINFNIPSSNIIQHVSFNCLQVETKLHSQFMVYFSLNVEVRFVQELCWWIQLLQNLKSKWYVLL